MPVPSWSLVFAGVTLFWAGVVVGGGAEWQDETGVISVLAGWAGMTWSAGGIRVYAIGTWSLTVLWYGAGLVDPSLRTPWLL